MDGKFSALLRATVQAGASGLLLKAGAVPVARVGKTLGTVEHPPLDAAWLAQLITSLLPERALERWKNGIEADFAFDAPEAGRFRANAYLHGGKPALALRHVKTEVPDFSRLNLPEGLARLAENPRGIVLISGAVGSGKSTTLAALVDHINRTRRCHIITLEDPVEFQFTEHKSVIEQREIGLDTPSFADGLRCVLRQDPDVIVIGELRDADSAHAAITAANVGHLVLATVHSNSAATAVQRIIELFPVERRDYAARIFAANLRAVVCQRLVQGQKSGILPAVEILLNNVSAAHEISQTRFESLNGIMEMSTGEGMQTFDLALQNLVAAKLITKDEALANATNRDALRMLFSGVTVRDTGRILGSR